MELLLFSADPTFVRAATAAGVDGVIVDWEHRGKARRQRDADTQINRDTLDDLVAVRRATQGRVICRINGHYSGTKDEVEQAIGAGVDEILLPMVYEPSEVEVTLKAADGTCGVGIMIETEEAVSNAAALGRMPISRAYIGLNDLAIERGSANLFEAVADGTVERVISLLEVPVGFGGLTLPDRGSPIPCRLLIGEMARLSCAFSFLRRSFHRDVEERQLPEAVRSIRSALAAARRRPAVQVTEDRRALAAAIHDWSRPAGRATGG